MRTVITSKQNVKGPKSTTFHAAKGPWRAIETTLCVSSAMLVTVDKYTPRKLDQPPNVRSNIAERGGRGSVDEKGGRGLSGPGYAVAEYTVSVC